MAEGLTIWVDEVPRLAIRALSVDEAHACIRSGGYEALLDPQGSAAPSLLVVTPWALLLAMGSFHGLLGATSAVWNEHGLPAASEAPNALLRQVLVWIGMLRQTPPAGVGSGGPVSRARRAFGIRAASWGSTRIVRDR